MAKKERLGSDPLKDGPLTWIQDTREEKKKEDKKDISDVSDVKALKRQSVLTSKSYTSKASKRHDVKSSKLQNTKSTLKRKHTVYLTVAQSKKLRVYAAAHEMSISEVIENLINEDV